MITLPHFIPSTAINRQAAELLRDVKQALRSKQKATIQVHVEVSGPQGEAVDDAAKLLFYYHPRLLPTKSAHCFTDTYDVDQALRVNTAASRVQNQYFIKLLTRRLGLRPLFGPGWEQGTYYSYTRYSTASASFGYKKLVAALQELATLPLAKSVLIPHASRHAGGNGLFQKLLKYYGYSEIAVHFCNFTEQELYLHVRIVAGKLRFEMGVMGKKQKFILDRATYDYLTLADSWDEDDYHYHRLSQPSPARFEAGAQYQIMLSELLYLLG